MLEISKPFMHDMMPLTNFYCLASANKASTSSPSLPASGETEPLLYGRMSSGNRESADPFTEAQDPSFYVTCWAWIQKFSQHMPTPSPMNDAISVPNHSSKNINLNKMRTNSNLPHICHILISHDVSHDVSLPSAPWPFTLAWPPAQLPSAAAPAPAALGRPIPGNVTDGDVWRRGNLEIVVNFWFRNT